MQNVLSKACQGVKEWEHLRKLLKRKFQTPTRVAVPSPDAWLWHPQHLNLRMNWKQRCMRKVITRIVGMLKEHSFYTPGAQAKQICEVIVKLIVIASVPLKHVNWNISIESLRWFLHNWLFQNFKRRSALELEFRGGKWFTAQNNTWLGTSRLFPPSSTRRKHIGTSCCPSHQGLLESHWNFK